MNGENACAVFSLHVKAQQSCQRLCSILWGCRSCSNTWDNRSVKSFLLWSYKKSYSKPFLLVAFWNKNGEVLWRPTSSRNQNIILPPSNIECMTSSFHRCSFPPSDSSYFALLYIILKSKSAFFILKNTSQLIKPLQHKTKSCGVFYSCLFI